MQIHRTKDLKGHSCHPLLNAGKPPGHWAEIQFDADIITKHNSRQIIFGRIMGNRPDFLPKALPKSDNFKSVLFAFSAAEPILNRSIWHLCHLVLATKAEKNQEKTELFEKVLFNVSFYSRNYA